MNGARPSTRVDGKTWILHAVDVVQRHGGRISVSDFYREIDTTESTQTASLIIEHPSLFEEVDISEDSRFKEKYRGI